METITMTGETRVTLRKGLGALRRSGYLPGVMYGAGTAPIPLQLKENHASQILNRLQGTVLIDLNLDGNVYKTVVREIQRDVLSGGVLHVDLMAVAMDQVLSMTIPIHLVGEAPAAATGEFAVITGLNEIEVECLPADIISSVEANVDSLSEMGDVLTVKHLVLPDEITVLTEQEEVIARVSYAFSVEEEEEEEVSEIDAEDVEVIEKGREYSEEDEQESENED